MKKIISLLIILPLLLCGCSDQSESASISGFSKNADVVFGDFSYSCVVVYNGSTVTVSAQSTAAAGLVITYDGKYVGITYDDISLSQMNGNFEPSNPAVALYEAFEYVNGLDQAAFSPAKDGFIAQGETSLGKFTLETDKEYCPVRLSFENSDLEFQFS